MDSRRPRWQRLSAGVAATFLLAAGAAAAGANFVAWPIAVALGAVSAGAGLVGTLRWDRYTTRTILLRDWNRVTDPGPGSDPAPTDSLLAKLNPDQEIVTFSTLRDHDVRRLLHWCTQPEEQRLWLMVGEAGCGKTRLLIEAAARLDQQWMVGWARRGHGAAAVDVAAAWARPVLLVVDDADTHPDFADILTAAVNIDTVRLVAAARNAGEWWPQLRETLPPHVDAGLPGHRPPWAASPRTSPASSNVSPRR